jgi:hypothetical protein
MPFVANDLQQSDLIAKFTKFPASCIARGIVGPAWEHKKKRDSANASYMKYPDDIFGSVLKYKRHELDSCSTDYFSS